MKFGTLLAMVNHYMDVHLVKN